MFQEMLVRVTLRITKSDRAMSPFGPSLKLAIPLRCLATGESYHSLAFSFRVAHNTISLFVPQVCDAITEEYQDEVLVTPTTPDGWKEVAEGFGRRWNFHNACGAIYGKHIRIKKPSKSGSAFHNYQSS